MLHERDGKPATIYDGHFMPLYAHAAIDDATAM